MKAQPRYYFSRRHLALGVAVCFLLLMSLSPIFETDLGWHIRAGQYLLDEGRPLREDTFTHSVRGQAWINHSWGAQAVLAGIERLLGENPPRFSRPLIFAYGVYTSVLALAGIACIYPHLQANATLKAGVLILTGLVCAVFWSPRPQMFSFALGAYVLYALYHYRGGWKRPLFALPLLMVLWANLHAGYIIAFILMGAFMVGESVERLAKGENALTWREIALVGGVALACLPALLLTPYGFRMYTYALETARLSVLNDFVAEWQSPSFKSPHMLTFPAMLLLTLGLAALLPQRVLTWGDLALISVTFAFALYAARNIPFFGLACAPPLSRVAMAWWQARGIKLRDPRPSRFDQTFNLVVVGMVGLLVVGRVGVGFSPRVFEAENPLLPLAGIAELRRQPPKGNLFNDYNWGGSLVYLAPEIPVFTDGRTDLYGDAFLLRYLQTLNGAQAWRETLQDYAIASVFIPPNTPLATLLREEAGWRVRYEDEVSILFERTDE